MVGDWVMDIRSKKPLRVNPFLAESDIPEWEPIPLTPEIWEKNGCGKNGNYGMCDEYYDLTIRNWGSGSWVLKYQCTEMPTPAEQMTCAFVHEFQHFLRHCEINKEIVL